MKICEVRMMINYVFGVDVGGTTVKMGLLETDGKLCSSWEIPTRTEQNGELILDDIAASIRKTIRSERISASQVLGIGMGVPGPVAADGTVYKCVNLGWGIFNVARKMQSLTGFRTKATNDANAAALGEMWMGGGRGTRNMVMVTLGTGVGGGVIVDGRIITGYNGSAGEIGHITVNPEEPEVCTCGRHGCLEQYASANGVARVARKYLKEHDDVTILRDFEIDSITSKEVFDAAKSEDPVGLKLVDDFGKMLARGLAQVACVVNPEIFVIGGGMAKAGDIVTDAIRKYFDEYTFHSTKGTLFGLAILGNEAGIYGTAKMVLDGDPDE